MRVWSSAAMPDARVSYRDGDSRARSLAGDGDRAAARGELDRVHHQVEQHLFDLSLVGVDRPKGLVRRDDEPDALLRRSLAQEGGRVGDQRRQREVGRLELHPPRLDLAEVEQVSNQRQQVLARILDDSQVLKLLRI